MLACFCLQMSTVQGQRGRGMEGGEHFPITFNRFSSEWLGGVVLPGGRGRSMSHYCDLSGNLGKSPVYESSFLSSYKRFSLPRPPPLHLPHLPKY